MQFVTLAAAAAGAATVLFPLLTQAIQLTNDAYTGIEAGKTFDLSWSGDGSPVDITLKTGPSNDLTTVTTLASAAAGTGATVSIPENVKPDTLYAFAITQSGTTNYSPQFTILVAVTANPVPTPNPTSSSPSSPPSSEGESGSIFQTSAFYAALALTTTSPTPPNPLSTTAAATPHRTPPSPSLPSAHFYPAPNSDLSLPLAHATSGLAIIHSAPVVVGPIVTVPSAALPPDESGSSQTAVVPLPTATGPGYYYGGTSTPVPFLGAAPQALLGERWRTVAAVAAAAAAAGWWVLGAGLGLGLGGVW